MAKDDTQNAWKNNIGVFPRTGKKQDCKDIQSRQSIRRNSADVHLNCI